MNKLPPELLLKIASYCDFAEVCALSKVNRLWNEVIDSSWKSLKNTLVERFMMKEYEDELDIDCKILHRDGRRKSLNLCISKYSEIANAVELLEDYWSDVHPGAYNCKKYVKPTDTEEFIESLFTPIFRSSTFREIELLSLKPSTLTVLIALLERFRPTIGNLFMDFIRYSVYGENAEVKMKELEDNARIVELSKPNNLDLFVAGSFTMDEFCEHFLKRFSYLYIPHMSMTLYNIRGDIRTGRGPLPKCRYLVCVGNDRNRTSALALPDLVDLVEEWSNNKREIVHYKFDYFQDDICNVAEQFEQLLMERNLPVRFEVMKENEEFLIEKIATRGDKQDGLRLDFGYGWKFPYARGASFVVIRTNDDENA